MSDATTGKKFFGKSGVIPRNPKFRNRVTTRVTTFRAGKGDLIAAENRIYEGVDEWLNSVAEAMSLTSDLLLNESTASPNIPEWVRNANRRLDESLYSPIHTALDELKLTPYRLGYAVGLST